MNLSTCISDQACLYLEVMKERSEKIPNPKELEKEISEFLAKKFGENVKIVSPMVMPQEVMLNKTKESNKTKPKINFDLKPEELIAYLDQYVVKQDNAKAILATKICTHFNRIKRAQESSDSWARLIRLKWVQILVAKMALALSCLTTY